MFLEGKDYLSIWEVAHRWAGYDPDSTDQKNLPADVRYYIHKIIEGFLGEELKLRRASGYRVPRESAWILFFDLNRWFVYLWECLNKDVFDRKKLSRIYVRRRELLDLCAREELEKPKFWLKERNVDQLAKPTINNRPKDEETDRLLCQAIAKTYWSIDPNIHPAHMAKAKAIQISGNGRFYKDPDTIKRWISEVDPLKDQRKSGRPVEIPYLIDLETGRLRTEGLPTFTAIQNLP